MEGLIHVVTTGSAMPSPHTSWVLLRDFARLLLLAVVLPALLLSAVVLGLSARNHRVEMRERLNAAAESSASAIDRMLRDHLAVIQVLAERRSASHDAADAAAWSADLGRLRRNFPGLRSAYVIDSEGRLRASDPAQPRATAPADISDRPHVKRARVQLISQISDVFQAQLFGTGTRVSVLAPLFSGKRFNGAVVGSLNAADFATDQSRWLRARGMELLVLDRRNVVVHASDGLRYRSLDDLSAAAWPALERNARGRSLVLAENVMRDGGAAYGRAEPLPFGWHVIALMPAATLETQLRRDATVMLGLLTMIIAGVLVVVWLRSRQQAESVHALLQRMQQVALHAGSPEAMPDKGEHMPVELAPLSSALAQLSERIGDAYAQTSQALSEQRRLREELQAAAHKLMTVQEQERHALSRELHDDIGQSITAIKLGAMALADEDRDTQRVIAGEIIATADQTIAKLRNLSLLLRPPQLDALGLEAALQGQMDAMARNARTRIELRYTALPMRPSPDVELACFRVAQEAVTNALRHAEAGKITVTVRPQDDGVLLDIDDDGRGINAGARTGLGLVTMRERTQQVGGRFEIMGRPGAGSSVRAWMPLHAAA